MIPVSVRLLTSRSMTSLSIESLSQPSTLSDHLLWQLGSLTLDPEARAAAELVTGNLNENGYLTASDEELVDSLLAAAAFRATQLDSFRTGRAESCTFFCCPKLKLRTRKVIRRRNSISQHLQGSVNRRFAVVREARSVVINLDPVGGERAISRVPSDSRLPRSAKRRP